MLARETAVAGRAVAAAVRHSTRCAQRATSPSPVNCGRPATTTPARSTPRPAGWFPTRRSSPPPGCCPQTQARSRRHARSSPGRASRTGDRPLVGGRRGRHDHRATCPRCGRRATRLPPPRVWVDRNPEADAASQAARAAVTDVAEELDIPVENLLTPETLRRVAWTPPGRDRRGHHRLRPRRARRAALADRGNRTGHRRRLCGGRPNARPSPTSPLRRNGQTIRAPLCACLGSNDSYRRVRARIRDNRWRHRGREQRSRFRRRGPDPVRPCGREGQYWNTRADDLIVKAMIGLLERNPNLPKDRVDDVAIAATTQTGDQGLTLGRTAAHPGRASPERAGYAIDRMCAGAMTSVTTIAGAIALRRIRRRDRRRRRAHGPPPDGLRTPTRTRGSSPRSWSAPTRSTWATPPSACTTASRS